VDAVWRAIREPAEIHRWFGWDYDGLEAEIRMIFADEVATASDGVLLLNNGDRFTVEPLDDGTRLRVTRPAPAEDVDWDRFFNDVDEGWLTFVQQLRFAFARHPGDDRRTVFLSGRSADGASPLDTIGLRGADDVGERYEVTAPTGDVLSGTVWYRARHQLGLTVDAFGDGLLVIGWGPAWASPALGTASAILTTYGLGDAAVAGLRARWAELWHANFERTPNAEQWGAA
jgi:hypothetical protein